MVKKLFFIVLVLGVLVFPQDMKVKASVDASQYQLGDYIHYTVEIEHAKSIRAILPSIKDSLKSLELVSLDKADTQTTNENKTTIKLHYTLIGFDSGAVTIPRFCIFYNKTGDASVQSVYTDSLLIHVSGIAIDTTAEIKDLKEPLTQPFDWTIVIIIVLAACVLAVSGYYLYRYYQKKKGNVPAEKQVILTPYQDAKRRLEALEKQSLWQQGLVKEYHTEITDIIRTYFEKTFSFPALEQTSGEILESLKRRNLSNQVLIISEHFFSNADMVKFAKFTPLPQVNEEMLKQAYTLIEEQNRLFSALPLTENEKKAGDNAHS